MGHFLSYSIISGLLMLAMFLAYRVLMARENQHSYNRGVLILIYIISFTFVPAKQAVEHLAASSVKISNESVNINTIIPSDPETASPVWGTILIWVFCVGMIAVAVKTTITWIKLSSLIRSGVQIKHENYTLVVLDDERFAPFSWISYAVISRTDYENNSTAILTHEFKHVAGKHWIDLLLAQIICVINWFNPAAWLMRDELMLIHEYQADMAVIDSGHQPNEYQMILIKKAVGARFPSLANSLNHSKLKKRITMMYKEKSGAGSKFKALALVPMLALALGVTSVPTVRAAVSTINNSKVSVSKGTEKSSNRQTLAEKFNIIGINKDGYETTIVIKGNNVGDNLTVTGGVVTNNGKTYDANSMQCNMTDGKARITVGFELTDELKDAALSLNINGSDVIFNLNDFLATAETIEINRDSDTTSSLLINGKSNNSLADSDMTILVDGKQISADELNNIKTELIKSIDIDKQTKTINIKLK